MNNGNHLQMPLYKHDQARYLREMAEWHQALALQPGSEGAFHSERAKSYQAKLSRDASDPFENSYY